MSLQRLGESDTIRAIQERCRKIAQYYRDHPDEARAIEAKIDADREHFKSITAPRQAQPAQDNTSRTAMRRKRLAEE